MKKDEKIVTDPTKIVTSLAAEKGYKKYSERDCQYVRSKVSFKGPISETLMDFWISYRDNKNKV